MGRLGRALQASEAVGASRPRFLKWVVRGVGSAGSIRRCGLAISFQGADHDGTEEMQPTTYMFFG